jgi:transglutaminase-like putative cysteine protease
VVLLTFTALTLYPTTVAAQLPWAIKPRPALRPPAALKPAAPQPESGEERFSRTLNEIHDILKEIVPHAAMPHRFRSTGSTATGKRGEKVLQAVGPKMRLESERAKPAPGIDLAARLKSLRGKYKELKSLEAEVTKGFKETEKDIRDKNLPAEILARHEQAVTEYERRKSEFTALMDTVEAADDGKGNMAGALSSLGEFMAKYPNAKAHAPADPGNLPFGSPKPATRAPYTSPAQFQTSRLFGEPVKVAQAGSLSGISLPTTVLPTTPTPADTAPTEDAQITQAIRDLATSLGNAPVPIYNWVRNNIEFIPTYGSIQGADLTLQTKRGNAFDTASLLIALLRAANVPARYVYGTIEVPADKAMNWVGGMSEPRAAINFMGKGGIPSMGVTQGGQVKWIRLEHVWVEAFVDYIPSRGAVNKNPNAWVPLDASFKQYTTIPSLIPADFTANMQDLAVAYAQSATQSPDGAWSTGFDANVLTARITTMQTNVAALLQSNPDKISLEEIIGGRSIAVSEPTILAGTLPNKIVAIGARLTALPANLRVTANVELYTVDGVGEEDSLLLSKPISLPSLGYASLNLTHAPATAQDASVWASYTNAGAQSFPAYLVNVKSRLSLDGATLAESGALRAGQDLILRVSFDGAGQNRPVTFRIVAGDEIEIGINGAGQSPYQGLALKDRTDLGTAANNLYVTAKVFWTQQDHQEKVLAALHGVAATRLPSAGIFASPMSVVYSFGIARQASYHSRQVDIKLSQLAAEALDGNPKKTTTFSLHAGIDASGTEGAAIEEVFSKPLGHGSNTMRLLQLANEQRIPIYHLNSDNIAAYRGALQHAPEVMADIDNALAAGLEVVIPQFRQTHGAWTGSGYIMMDPVTGSADYRVSGGLSGNFDGEACVRSTQPIKIPVPNVSLIWWILFGWMVDDDFNFNGGGIAVALAKVALVTAMVGLVALAAPVVVPAVALVSRAAFAALVFFFAETAMAGDDEESCDCEPKILDDRKGGNSIFTQVHNACADRFTDYPTHDVELRALLGAKAFDGLRRAEAPPGTFYEIKTGLFYSTIKAFSLTRPSAKKFLDVLRAKAVVGYAIERYTSGACGFEFRYGVRDGNLMLDMQQYFIESGFPGEAARVFANGC